MVKLADHQNIYGTFFDWRIGVTNKQQMTFNLGNYSDVPCGGTILVQLFFVKAVL